MTNHGLTEDQYKILNTQRAEFECLASNGYTRNLDRNWLKSFQAIYQAIYSAPVSITCKACITDGMQKLWRKMKEFEAVGYQPTIEVQETPQNRLQHVKEL